MTAASNQVHCKSVAYQEMEFLWELPDDLLGGTLRMRKRASKWLPQKEAEDFEDYTIRVQGSFLFPGYRRTLDDLCAKPFERAVTVSGDLPEFLEDMPDDVDRTGTNITTFAKEVFREAVHRGLTHVLVDFPQVAPGATLADRRATRARPVFIHVQPTRLLGVRTETLPDGSEVLSQIRIFEELTIPDGPYGERIVERIRVITREVWELWERTEGAEQTAFGAVDTAGPEINTGPNQTNLDDGSYALIDAGTHSFGEVPLLTLYYDRTGPWQGRPVLEDLAQLNLAHFQSDSRQRSYLDFARIGTTLLLGFDKDDVKQGITWGINRYIRNSKGPREADGKVLSHPTAPLDAGRTDLDNLKEEMEAVGTAPLVQRAASITATGEAREEGRGLSKAQAWVRDLETFLVKCFEHAAQWLQTELPDDFAVDVFSDFGITTRPKEEVDQLFSLAEAGRITPLTLLREIKRRGYFADSFDPEEELDALEEMGPDLGAMTSEMLERVRQMMEGEEDGTFTTGEADGHTHTYSAGATQTSSADGHTHPIDANGMIGEADGHTHTADPNA